MKTDIEIAREAILKPISEICRDLSIDENDYDPYGRYKAKLSEDYLNKIILFLGK